MNLFSPDRARTANGLLMYYDDLGPVGPMPELNLTLDHKDETVHISVMLLNVPNVASWYECVCFIKDLPYWLTVWRNDPEWILRNVFNWPGMQRTSQGQSQGDVFSIEDL